MRLLLSTLFSLLITVTGLCAPAPFAKSNPKVKLEGKWWIHLNDEDTCAHYLYLGTNGTLLGYSVHSDIPHFRGKWRFERPGTLHISEDYSTGSYGSFITYKMELTEDYFEGTANFYRRIMFKRHGTPRPPPPP
jgi:hypothetical protein